MLQIVYFLCLTAVWGVTWQSDSLRKREGLGGAALASWGEVNTNEEQPAYNVPNQLPWGKGIHDGWGMAPTTGAEREATAALGRIPDEDVADDRGRFKYGTIWANLYRVFLYAALLNLFFAYSTDCGKTNNSGGEYLGMSTSYDLEEQEAAASSSAFNSLSSAAVAVNGFNNWAKRVTGGRSQAAKKLAARTTNQYLHRVDLIPTVDKVKEYVLDGGDGTLESDNVKAQTVTVTFEPTPGAAKITKTMTKAGLADLLKTSNLADLPAELRGEVKDAQAEIQEAERAEFMQFTDKYLEVNAAAQEKLEGEKRGPLTQAQLEGIDDAAADEADSWRGRRSGGIQSGTFDGPGNGGAYHSQQQAANIKSLRALVSGEKL